MHTRTQRRWQLSAVAALLSVLSGSTLVARPPATPVVAARTLSGGTDDLWLSGGGNARNTRFASRETLINKDNVSGLVPKWVFKADGNVLATPAVDAGAVYFPDSGGSLFKVDRVTGALLWKRSIASYTGGGADQRGVPWSRTTPIVFDNLVVIGTRDAFVVAVDKVSGELIWKTKVESHPAAIITSSPVLDSGSGRIFVGVSSIEEQLAGQPGYACCTLRGSVLALDVRTGHILWKTYTVPEGYSGGAVVGGTPAVDVKRGSIYITTSNNYSVPPQATECAVAAGKDPAQLARCTSPQDYFDAVLALDMRTGTIKWGRKTWPYDAFSYACMTPGKCKPDSPDYDFISGVNLLTTQAGTGKPARDLVGAGQKSGMYWALDPQDGSVVWGSKVGPGGFVGGIQWGTATDGRRIYVAISNWSPTQSQTYQLKSGQTISWGFYAAIDAASGAILWQTADPTPKSYPIGMVSVANGVMYAGSYDKEGRYYALDAGTGAILWHFASGGAVVSGAAIVQGAVYWGSGWSGGANDKVYAFALSP